MQRTDYSSDIDGALAGRNAGSQGFHEVARSGNGNMMTDLLADDCSGYKEVEGLGEGVEEMDNVESAAETAGDKTRFRPFREVAPGEQPPYAPEAGKGWIKRRIRMNSRRPGGNMLTRTRWVQVSPERYAELLKSGQIKETAGTISMLQGLGFVDISASTVRNVAIGAGLAVGLLYLLKRRKGASIIAAG